MTEKILSQDEMDALLQGVQSGQIDTRTAPGPTAGVRPYDLLNLNHFVTLHPVMAIKVVSNRMIISCRVAMRKLFRKPVTMELTIVEMNKFDTFIETIPPMSSFHLLKVEPLSKTVLLILTAEMVYFLLDHFYGGGGKLHARTEGGYTLIERMFIQKVVDLLLSEFQKAWDFVRPVKISMTRTDSTARTMRVLPDKDWVVTARLKLGFDESGQDFYFCFPFAHLEPLREKLYGGHEIQVIVRTDKSDAALKQHLIDSGYVTAAVLIGSAALTVPEVIRLEVGDVVQLDRKADADFELMFENISKFYGRPGTFEGKNAFQIKSLVPPKP